MDAIVITHFHLDHWGDLVPWVWGTIVRPRRRGAAAGAVAAAAAAATISPRSASASASRTCSSARSTHPALRGGAAVRGGRLDRHRHARCRTTRSRHTACGSTNARRTLAYSGDAAPSDRLVELARDADLFLCEATLERGELDGEPRGHLVRGRGDRRLRGVRRAAAPPDAPARRAAARRRASSAPTTGWSWSSSSRRVRARARTSSRRAR